MGEQWQQQDMHWSDRLVMNGDINGNFHLTLESHSMTWQEEKMEEINNEKEKSEEQMKRNSKKLEIEIIMWWRKLEGIYGQQWREENEVDKKDKSGKRN
jgi:hypothetical protein